MLTISPVKQVYKKPYDLSRVQSKTSGILVSAAPVEKDSQSEIENLSAIKHLKVDESHPLNLAFSAINSISIQKVKLYDEKSRNQEVALLLNVHGTANDDTSFVISLAESGPMLSSKRSDFIASECESYEHLYHTLSLREQKVLSEVARGCTSDEISSKLHIATNTVKNHRKNFKKKLGFTENREYSKFLKWALSYDSIS